MKASIQSIEFARPQGAIGAKGHKRVQAGVDEVTSIDLEDDLFSVSTRRGTFFVPLSAVQCFQVASPKAKK